MLLIGSAGKCGCAHSASAAVQSSVEAQSCDMQTLWGSLATFIDCILLFDLQSTRLAELGSSALCCA